MPSLAFILNTGNKKTRELCDKDEIKFRSLGNLGVELEICGSLPMKGKLSHKLNLILTR